MKKRVLALVGISALLLCFCCGCAEEQPNEEDAVQGVHVQTLNTEVYSLALPETVTAEEGEDGALTLFRDGVEVGGVQVIPYEDAEDLDIDDIDTEEGGAKFDALRLLISPEDEDAYMFSTSGDTFCLSLYPEQEEDPVETMHYFFPQGDVFYDLFLHRDGTISDTEEQVISDSFAFAS